MSGPSSTWNMEAPAVDDPLKGSHKKPVISSGGPNATYVGRVIIELWDGTTARDDADRIAMVVGAVDGHHAELLERIATALTQRLRRGNPFKVPPAPQ